MELLTQAEHDLMTLLGEVANRFKDILGKEHSRNGDWSEAVHHIHCVQNAVLAQAAARAYPDLYRLKGGGWPVASEDPG